MTKQPVDVWMRIGQLFNVRSDDTPELYMMNIAPEQLYHCIVFLLERARDITTQFQLAEKREPVWTPSPTIAASALAQGMIVGAIGLQLPALPHLVIFIDHNDRLSIGYTVGKEWNAMRLLALMDLIDRLRTIAPTARILLDPEVYSASQQILFDHTLRELTGHTSSP